MVVESSPRYSLEIKKGKTSFPVRPVSGGRLTIGAGSCCGLQLTGREMPILHSVIHVEEEVARIEAMVAQPRLLLNGIPLRTSELSDGDLITIGPIEFEFCQSRPHTATNLSTAGLSGSPLQTSAPLTPDKKRDYSMTKETTLKDLSASELVDLIEQDFHLIEKYESRREQGAAALMSQLHQLNEEQEEQDFQQESLSEQEQLLLLADLENMMQELTRFSEELHQRANQLSSREKQYDVAAASLLETQEKLASQLDRTLDHVGSIKEDRDEAGPRRAIA